MKYDPKSNLADYLPLEENEIGILIKYDALTGYFSLNIEGKDIIQETIQDFIEPLLLRSIQCWKEQKTQVVIKEDKKFTN
jgi:hypothetical protein